MILDTSFLIDLLRGEERVKEWVKKFDSGEEIPVINPITTMELWEGAHLSGRTEDELEKIRELVEGLTVKNFDLEDGKLSGEISAILTKRGNPIDIEDIMIAATAINSNQSVITRNPEHFRQIEGLKVESY